MLQYSLLRPRMTDVGLDSIADCCGLASSDLRRGVDKRGCFGAGDESDFRGLGMGSEMAES